MPGPGTVDTMMPAPGRTAAHIRRTTGAPLALIAMLTTAGCSGGPVDAGQLNRATDVPAEANPYSPDAPPPVDVTYQVPTGDPVVFVTIDDGHHPSQQALDYVRANDMPVSLFLNEDPVQYHSSYFDEYLALGNYVHTHTQNHHDLTQLKADAQRSEICGMVDLLHDQIEHSQQVGSMLRAPYGASDERTARVSSDCGLDSIVHWSATAENGTISTSHGHQLQPGDIVLTHFTDDLPQNLGAIQQAAEQAGLSIARLEDYL